MKTIKITVDPNIYLNQIPEFKNGIPNNSFIHKGRCGIGGTRIELNHRRHSIIIVPTVAPIKGKLNIGNGKECLVQNGLFPLYGGKSLKPGEKLQFVKQYLESDEQSDSEFKKIFTTPDSFRFIIQAANELGKLQWLYDNFFLLFDEAHSVVTEMFRKEIKRPLEYFWNFKRKAIISATPFYFSDPKFTKLTRYEIAFTKSIGDITVVNTNKIQSTLEYILTHSTEYPGNVHIFYNSVSSLAQLLRIVSKENPEFDCNIFCSSSDENFKKLDELKPFFNENPNTAEYKKYNFYTTKYFEAWDLHDSNSPTIILATDLCAPNTKIGIQNKGVQAVGRFRVKNGVQPERIIHITNTRGTSEKFKFPEIYNQINLDANSSIEAYNKNLKQAKESKLLPNEDLRLSAEKYAYFNFSTGEATKDPILVDQWANLKYSDQVYNNIEFVKQAWEQSHYNVTVKVIPDDLLGSLIPKIVAEKIKTFCLQLELLEQNKDNFLFNNQYDLALERLKGDFEQFELA